MPGRSVVIDKNLPGSSLKLTPAVSQILYEFKINQADIILVPRVLFLLC